MGDASTNSAARPQHARELRPVAGREHTERKRGHVIAQRQRTPGVAGHRGNARMGSRGPAQRVLGEVQRQPGSIPHPLQDPRQVPARARAEVDHAAARIGVDGAFALALQLLGQRIEVSGAEERRTSGDHRRRVRAAELGVSRQEAEIALAGNVEGVTRLAAHGCVVAHQRPVAVGAAQEVEGAAEHERSVPGSEPWASAAAGE